MLAAATQSLVLSAVDHRIIQVGKDRVQDELGRAGTC